MTLMVKGTCESELRTRFCPTRFTYSVITGSCTSLTVDSTCWAYDLPIAICFSTLYQLPKPRLHPTLRFPTASTSVLPPLCLTLSGSASWIWGILEDPALPLGAVLVALGSVGL